MTGSAQAADLPAKSATPVEYVRVCSTYGTGFFYVPGTETCLRVPDPYALRSGLRRSAASSIGVSAS